LKRGYILAEVAVAIVIAALLAGAFTAMTYYMNIASNSLKSENSKIILDVVRSRVLELARDVDNDSFFELPMHQSDNSLPLEVAISVDAWGESIYYVTQDFGVINAVDLNYSHTADAISVNANIQGRVISKGANRTLETNATHASAQGDDIMVEIGTGELNHFKLYGGSEIEAQTRNYNSAIVSNTAPSNPSIGTLWYNTDENNMTIFDGVTWKGL
jgi:hypothetical protein